MRHGVIPRTEKIGNVNLLYIQRHTCVLWVWYTSYVNAVSFEGKWCTIFFLIDIYIYIYQCFPKISITERGDYVCNTFSRWLVSCSSTGLITVTSQWMRWRLKSSACRLFAQPFVQAQIKKNQSSAPLAFFMGIHRGPMDSPHKGPVTRKMFSFYDVIIRSNWIYFSVV